MVAEPDVVHVKGRRTEVVGVRPLAPIPEKPRGFVDPPRKPWREHHFDAESDATGRAPKTMNLWGRSGSAGGESGWGGRESANGARLPAGASRAASIQRGPSPCLGTTFAL